jgi:hypothetical protein
MNDTLVFSSSTFKSKKGSLKEEDFITPQFVVTLEVSANELKEALIAAKKVESNL